ncbi:MAG: ABC transporter ATP-binding protein [Planctomycetota bacterium]
MSLLTIDNVSLRFGGLTAVNQVSFTVPVGSITAVIGPNGAGKTSLFNVVTGLYQPSAGRVLVDGAGLYRSCTPATVAGWIGAAALTGLAATVAINANSAWDAAINAHAGVGAFPWSAAGTSLANAFAPSAWTVVPALIGAVIGGVGAWLAWSRTRCTPDQVFRRGIARTFQNIRLFTEMSCRDNLLVALATLHAARPGPLAVVLQTPGFRRAEAAARAEADALLAFVGLGDVAEHAAGSLPYGHQRRLEIARALAGRPRLLLLDEPAAGMNESESAALMQLIRQIRDRGVTVLLIEHDMHVVMGISDHVVVLQYGAKIAEGTPDVVRKNPQVIEAYLGAPSETAHA